MTATPQNEHNNETVLFSEEKRLQQDCIDEYKERITHIPTNAGFLCLLYIMTGLVSETVEHTQM